MVDVISLIEGPVVAVFVFAFMNVVGASYMTTGVGQRVTLSCGNANGRTKTLDWYRTREGSKRCPNPRIIRDEKGEWDVLCERISRNGFILSNFSDKFSIVPSGYRSSALNSLLIDGVEADDTGTYFCLHLNNTKSSLTFLKVLPSSTYDVNHQRIDSKSTRNIRYSGGKTWETKIVITSTSINRVLIPERKTPVVKMAILSGSPLLLISIFLLVVCRKRNLKHRSTIGRSDRTTSQDSTTTDQNSIRLPDLVSSFSSFSSSFTDSFISSTSYSYDYPNAEETFSRGHFGVDPSPDNSIANVDCSYANAGTMEATDSVPIHVSRSSSRQPYANVVSRFSHGVARVFSSRSNRTGNSCLDDMDYNGYANDDDPAEHLSANEANDEMTAEEEEVSLLQLGSTEYANDRGRSFRRLSSCPALGRTHNGRPSTDSSHMRLTQLEHLLDNLKLKLS